MKLIDLVEILCELPEDFDGFDVVFSKVRNLDDDHYERHDDPITGIFVDNDTKELIFMDFENSEMFKEGTKSMDEYLKNEKQS